MLSPKSENHKSLPEFILTWAVSRAIPAPLLERVVEIVENERAWETSEALGWDEPSIYWQTKKPHDFGALACFMQEDGTLWQARPEKPRQITDPKTGKVKTVKYETPKGAEVAPFLPPIDPETRAKIEARHGIQIPADAPFWDFVAARPDLPIMFVEGLGKSLSLLAQGFIPIGLSGCNGGYRTSKPGSDGENVKTAPHLIPGLERFAGATRKVYLVPDSDSKPETVKVVDRAMSRFGLLWADRGCQVSVVKWDNQGGKYKGPDDLIAGLGVAAWEQALEKAQSLEEWRKETRRSGHKLTYVGRGGKERLVPHSKAVGIFLEEWGDTIAYNTTTSSFWRYGAESDGLWSELPDVLIQRQIQEGLEETGVGYGPSTPTGILSLLKARVASSGWTQPKRLIPMKNGVLNIETRQLAPHDPSQHFTWQLPYEYDPGADCKPIIDWLRFAQDGDESRVQFLRAVLRAAVTGGGSLQIIPELIGPGGTGKSTFVKLAISLVGKANTHATDLERLEKNRFESALLYGKRLVTLSDEKRWGGDISMLKQISGGDEIPFERKHCQAQESFAYDGLVIIVANEPLQTSDLTSGFHRRRRPCPFNRVVAEGDRRQLIEFTSSGEMWGEFAPLIPGLLNWVLGMSEDEMRALLVNTYAHVPSLKAAQLEVLLDSNPLAQWFDSHCLYAEGLQTQVGTAQALQLSEGEDGSRKGWREYSGQGEFLYANYRAYCDRSGLQPIALRRFSNLLLSLTRDQLKLNVEVVKPGNRTTFKNIGLRSISDGDAPSPVEAKPTANPTVPANPDFPELPSNQQALATQFISLLKAANTAEDRKNIWFRRVGDRQLFDRLTTEAQRAIRRALEETTDGQTILRSVGIEPKGAA